MLPHDLLPQANALSKSFGTEVAHIHTENAEAAMMVRLASPLEMSAAAFENELAAVVNEPGLELEEKAGHSQQEDADTAVELDIVLPVDIDVLPARIEVAAALEPMLAAKDPVLQVWAQVVALALEVAVVPATSPGAEPNSDRH